jgi:hypothetical protein
MAADFSGAKRPGKRRMLDFDRWTEKKLATPARFERATCGLEIRCSIQLSYGAVSRRHRFTRARPRMKAFGPAAPRNQQVF